MKLFVITTNLFPVNQVFVVFNNKYHRMSILKTVKIYFRFYHLLLINITQ